MQATCFAAATTTNFPAIAITTGIASPVSIAVATTTTTTTTTDAGACRSSHSAAIVGTYCTDGAACPLFTAAAFTLSADMDASSRVAATSAAAIAAY